MERRLPDRLVRTAATAFRVEKDPGATISSMRPNTSSPNVTSAASPATGAAPRCNWTLGACPFLAGLIVQAFATGIWLLRDRASKASTTVRTTMLSPMPPINQPERGAPVKSG